MREKHQRIRGTLLEDALIIWKTSSAAWLKRWLIRLWEHCKNPRLKEQKKAEVKEHARKSVRALLEANKRLVEEQRANVTEAPAQKKSRGEELG